MVVIIGAFLGTLAGSHGTPKALRRWGIPGLIAIYGVVFHSWWCLLSFAMVGPLSMGYGIPDDLDDGSSMGRFWYKIVGSNTKLLDALVRGTLALLVSISLIYAPIISGYWAVFGITTLVFLVIHLAFSAFIIGEPSWEWMEYELLAEDLIVYANMITYVIININLIHGGYL